jgi:succinyl-diaminopimelate desuccinylase
MSDTLTLVQELIHPPSVTQDDAGCHAERLEKCGFHCEHLRFAEVDNLWAVRGQQAPILVFAGHTDLEPIGPEELLTLYGLLLVCKQSVH